MTLEVLGDVGMPPVVGATGRQRTQAFMLMATGCYRASHLVGGVWVLVSGIAAHRAVPVLLGLCLAASAWSAWLFARAWRRGWFRTAEVWADVALCGMAAPCVGALTLIPASRLWIVLLGSSAAAMAGAAFGRPATLGAVTAIIAADWYASGNGVNLVHAGHINSVLFSAALGLVFQLYLRRQGELLDAANARTLAVESARSAERARFAERTAQHRALHDTVLSTLTTIARGRVDANSPQVRERCAREADYLRRLIQRDAAEGADGLAEQLERAIRSAELFGLRVVARYRDLPPDVPAPVAAALAQAAGEALNNVLRHSGTTTAWLTATGDGRGVTVTVVDRGCGFAADAAPGLGLGRSIRDRLAEVGGTARIDSAPGEGVVVELRWPQEAATIVEPRIPDAVAEPSRRPQPSSRTPPAGHTGTTPGRRA